MAENRNAGSTLLVVGTWLRGRDDALGHIGRRATPFPPRLEILGPDEATAVVPGTRSVPAADPQEAEWRRFVGDVPISGGRR